MATIYERLFNVKSFIMAGNPFPTGLGGGIMEPEVVDAMREAAPYNVSMLELLESACGRIADMLGVEAAFITSGACAGLSLAAAATMTGDDIRLMEQLPDTESPATMKNQLIMQRGHFNNFAACLKAPGAKLVEVGGGYLPRGPAAGQTWEKFSESWETAQNEGWLFHSLDYDEAKQKYIRVFKTLPWHIENAINDRTAALVYVRSRMAVRGEYEVSLEETVRIAKKNGLPVIVDFAAEAFRKANFRKALDKGADLVIFSGGKDIRGPNDTGLVLGKKEWVNAVKLNSSPHYRIIFGRGFKVSKEQIVGLFVALQKHLQIDEEAQFRNDLEHCHAIASQFENFPNVQASVYLADEDVEGILYKFPTVHLKLDEQAIGMKASQVISRLFRGEPRISVSGSLTKWGIIEIATRGLKEEEDAIVIDRIKAILSKGDNKA